MNDRLDPAALAEEIAALRRAIVRAQPCGVGGCDELNGLSSALERLTSLLALSAATGPERHATALEAAKALAEISSFEVPPSHRARSGQVVTAVKRALVVGLSPLHLETLRPQVEFNRAAVAVVEHLGTHRTLRLREALGPWIRARLSPLVDPLRHAPRSHRAGLAGAAVSFVKRAYLQSASPLLEPVLAGQRAFNELLLETVLEIAEGARAEGALELRIEALARQVNPLAGAPLHVRALSPLWREVLRQQVRFNEELSIAIAELVGVRPRPLEGPRAQAQEEWLREHLRAEAGRVNLDAAREELISVLIPVATDEDARGLAATLTSLSEQRGGRWEAIVAVARGLQVSADVAGPLRIVTADSAQCDVLRNAALEHVSGDWIGIVEAGDRLAPHAIARLASAFSDAQVAYTDEALWAGDGRATAPFCKPEWSPELLRSVDYLSRFTLVRTSLAREVGGWRAGFLRAVDHEFALRITERARGIQRIPAVLYFRATRDRRDLALTADADSARAVQEQVARAGERGIAEPAGRAGVRVRYEVAGTPLVTIIVPFKDKPELLETVVRSLLERTDYPHWELLLVSNQSVRPETFELLERLVDPRIRKLSWDFPFNYPAINNFAAREARGEFLLFLNNDIEAIDGDWLTRMLGQAQRSGVGAVGAKLLFPDGSVQHNGVVIGIQGFAAHPFWRLPEDCWTPFGHTSWTRNWLAVTSACELIRRDLFREIGGFDERFQVCGSDVEIGLRLVARGLRVVCESGASLFHHESASRRTDAIPENDHWQSFVAYRSVLEKGDPFYSPHLSLLDTDASLKTDPRDGQALALQALAHEVPSARSRVRATLAQKQRHEADHLEALDIPDGAREPPEAMTRFRALPAFRRATWFVPHFGQVAGGLHTIFRFAHLLRINHGVESRFVIFDAPEASARELEAKATALLPASPGRFEVLRSPSDVLKLEDTDLALGTHWTSVPSLMRHPRSAARAYFVQDHEPQFHAAGALSGLAEQTYRLGLYGIFNTRGLHDYIRGEYGMDGMWFEPSVDHSVFHAKRPSRSGPPRLFFYARPENERNAFELGLAVIRELRKRLGSAVEIVTAGAPWDPEAYGLRGAVTQLGVLPYAQTGALYRECDVGLCFMFTKHPSYLPLELMACGVTVVTNDNPVNRWLFRDGENCLLAAPTVSSVVARLETALTEPGLRAAIGQRAAAERLSTTWDAEVARVFQELRASEFGGRAAR